MSEIKREAKTFFITYSCDDCEKIPNPGCVLTRLPIVLPTHPAIYTYECPNCKKHYEFWEIYPSVEYE